jgi:hypothetical protein
MVVKDSVAKYCVTQKYGLTWSSYFRDNNPSTTLNCWHIISKPKLHVYSKNKNQCQVSLAIIQTKIQWHIRWTLSAIISFVLKGSVLQKMALHCIAGFTRMRWYLPQDSGPSSALSTADFLLLHDDSQVIFRTCIFNKMGWWTESNMCVHLISRLNHEC